jgi:cytochrome c biogenesis protein CcdA
MTDLTAAVSLTVLTAIIDSINPFAIGVLILLLLKTKDRAEKQATTAISYMISFYTVYLLTGLTLISIIKKFNITEITAAITGALLIFVGIIELKDIFTYHEGFQFAIRPEKSEKISRILKTTSFASAIGLGLFVATVELPATGAPYLGVTAILSLQDQTTAAILLAVYNTILILPLVAITYFASKGSGLNIIHNWKQGSRKNIRAASAIFMIISGAVLAGFSIGMIRL